MNQKTAVGFTKIDNVSKPGVTGEKPVPGIRR
jgi:hypothetical protein